MDPRLGNLISDYQARVSNAVSMLEDAGIHRPSSSFAWSAMDVAQDGSLLGGFSYFKHGFGCTVGGPQWRVDFDFGERGEIDGFDPYRLRQFAGSRMTEYGFAPAEEIESAVQEAHNAGDLTRSDQYRVSKAGVRR